MGNIGNIGTCLGYQVKINKLSQTTSHSQRYQFDVLYKIIRMIKHTLKTFKKFLDFSRWPNTMARKMTPKIHQKNQCDLYARENHHLDSLVKIRSKCQYETPYRILPDNAG